MGTAATKEITKAARDAALERLTARYLELRQQAFRDAVDTVIELGEILIQVEALLGREFGDWLDRVATADRTAHNYVALAELAEEQPGVIQTWKELGPTKLYRIAHLPASSRRALLKPSQAEKLADATDREFAEIVAPYVVKKRKVTADMRAHGLRMKVKAWTNTIRSTRVRGIKDADLRKGLDAELGELVRGIEALRRQIR